MLEYITNRDHRLMHRVNKWTPPAWVQTWALAATRGGDGWLWYGLTILILMFGGEERFAAAASGLIAAGVGVAVFVVMKKQFGRPRPCVLAPHAWAKLLPPDQFSFPSGHTITAFAFAVPLSMFYPVLTPFLMFCAISIAISRVLLGMHFLSDIVVGAAIGTMLGFCAYHLYY
jgi:undecaprenyl-diphosphatase